MSIRIVKDGEIEEEKRKKQFDREEKVRQKVQEKEEKARKQHLDQLYREEVARQKTEKREERARKRAELWRTMRGWKTAFYVVAMAALLAFGHFVWPTPYFYKNDGRQLVRINRAPAGSLPAVAVRSARATTRPS